MQAFRLAQAQIHFEKFQHRNQLLFQCFQLMAKNQKLNKPYSGYVLAGLFHAFQMQAIKLASIAWGDNDLVNPATP